MRSCRLKTCLRGTGILTFLLSAGVARAEGLALDRFDPAPAGDRMFGVPSPYATGELTPHLMLLADYAHDPLVLRSEPADRERGSVVKNQLFLNLNVGLALWNRLNLDLSVPIALAQNGDAPTVGGQTFSSPSSAQFGDLRFGARVRVLDEQRRLCVERVLHH